MILTIFYLFVSFNILTQDSPGIKNKEGGFQGAVRNYQGGRVANNRGRVMILFFEKGRVAIFSAVT